MKKILLTGANGFLGKHIISGLLDFQIITLGRENADVEADLRLPLKNLPNVDHVIHAAGKAHMLPRCEEENKEFFDVNVLGTRNLLAGLENLLKPKSFLFISTVAVYGKQSGILIDENTALLALDPYGKSKIDAEEIVFEWCKKNNVICTIFRLPLVVGMDPKGNLGSMIQGIKKGYYFNIDGGKAKKSMVLAEDIVKIIPTALDKEGIYNLTDGYHPTFSELSEVIAQQINKNHNRNMPLWLARLVAKCGDLFGDKAPINTSKLNKILSDLTFDDSKARSELGWNPRSVVTNLFFNNI